MTKIFNKLFRYTSMGLYQSGHQDLRAYNLTLNEAVDLAQNRPLWRLMSTCGATLLVVHVRKEEGHQGQYSLIRQKLHIPMSQTPFVVLLTPLSNMPTINTKTIKYRLSMMFNPAARNLDYSLHRNCIHS